MSLRIYINFLLLTWCITSVQLVSEERELGHENHKHHSSERRLDPFEEISQSSFLNASGFKNFIDEFFENLDCDGHDSGEHHNDSSHEKECESSLCIDAEELIEVVGGNSSEGISEGQLANASIILLYLATELDHYCHEYVNISALSVDIVTSSLLVLIQASPDHQHIHESGIKSLLGGLKASINHEGHDHHEGDSHEDEHTSDEHHASSGEDHQDQHDEHSDEHVEHSEEGGEHSEEGDEHDEHDEHDHSESLVLRARCLAPDALLYYLGSDVTNYIEADQIGDMAAITIYLLSQGYDVHESCRLIPVKTGFFQNVFSRFDGNSSHLPIAGLEELMTSLGINPEAAHQEDSHDGHDHRRKRSADHWSSRLERAAHSPLAKRIKRQAAVESQYTQCYSAEQLTALYEAGSNLDQSLFQELCPALISQQLYGDCTPASPSTSESGITDGEKYGYSSAAVFIICLCSILGVALIPCASHQVYHVIMAVFLGLAVGTLFADAILHLIPSAFGVHGHEDGHDHGDEIVLEEFARYGLVIMAALYFFYILELVLSSCGGHSHGEEKANGYNHNHHEHLNMNAMNGDEEKGKKYIVKDQDVKSNHDTSTVQLDSSSRGFLGVSPVVIMIVLGDAIHNCADGLVIGASFSRGVSTGIASSIAVFCHELPHELGDFAVLLQSGCSFGKAVFLNLVSSLTAFLGLYIGISLSTDSTTERWIFACASGMFIYIALVDLLPQLVKGRGANIAFHNIGILLGFAVMLVLVVFEEHIEV